MADNSTGNLGALYEEHAAKVLEPAQPIHCNFTRETQMVLVLALLTKAPLESDAARRKHFFQVAHQLATVRCPATEGAGADRVVVAYGALRSLLETFAERFASDGVGVGGKREDLSRTEVS